MLRFIKKCSFKIMCKCVLEEIWVIHSMHSAFYYNVDNCDHCFHYVPALIGYYRRIFFFSFPDALILECDQNCSEEFFCLLLFSFLCLKQWYLVIITCAIFIHFVILCIHDIYQDCFSLVSRISHFYYLYKIWGDVVPQSH